MCEGKLFSTHVFCLLYELAISTSIIRIQLDPLVERLQPCPSNQDQNQKKKIRLYSQCRFQFAVAILLLGLRNMTLCKVGRLGNETQNFEHLLICIFIIIGCSQELLSCEDGICTRHETQCLVPDYPNYNEDQMIS